MENLIQNSMTYWYFPAFFAFIAVMYLHHLWRNRISNTLNAVNEFHALQNKFKYEVSSIGSDIDKVMLVSLREEFPLLEIKQLMRSFIRVKKAYRSFHYFYCRYGKLIQLAPKLFNTKDIDSIFNGIEKRFGQAMEQLNHTQQH